MIEQAKKRFANDKNVTVVKHDFSIPLPEEQLGKFDADSLKLSNSPSNASKKKTALHRNIQSAKSKGVFCNLEHVSSPTDNLHMKFLAANRLDTEKPRTLQTSY